jgi:hypothetical protein
MVGYVKVMGEGRVVHRVLVGKPAGKRPLVNTGVGVRIILRRIFRKLDGGVERNDLAQVRDRSRTHECGHETSGSKYAEKFLPVCEPVSLSTTLLRGVSK